METDEEKKKKINDDVVVFMRKRSETEAPRYTARLKTYVDFQQKRRRAAAALGQAASAFQDKIMTCSCNKKNDDQKAVDSQENHSNDEDRLSRRRGCEKCMHRAASFSRSGTVVDPEDRGCRGPRKRSGRKKRRRSCQPATKRRRRRRRSGCRSRRRSRGRRSCRSGRRRRRRSSSRSRRRRSCGRKRKRRTCPNGKS